MASEGCIEVYAVGDMVAMEGLPGVAQGEAQKVVKNLLVQDMCPADPVAKPETSPPVDWYSSAASST